MDRYKIEQWVAEGGMQQVFRATDLAFNRIIALKVPKNASAEKRFARSAQVSARITHTNVAKTLDYFEIGEMAYLVEEFIVGMNLDDALRNHFFYLDPHLAAHCVYHLAKGLAAAHHADVFHRDLKPSNIMISADPNLASLKITDFGISKMAGSVIEDAVEGGEESITSSQTMVGTLPYMSPEMVQNPQSASKPADIWALGAMLYKLLSGELPFGSGFRAIPVIIEAKPPSQPAVLRKIGQFTSLGNELWKIVLSCLKKDPSARPTADKLVEFCASLCFSEATRRFGTVSDASLYRGTCGFIIDDQGETVFFHKDSCFGPRPEKGIRVLFSSDPGRPYPRAFPVLAIRDGTEPK